MKSPQQKVPKGLFGFTVPITDRPSTTVHLPSDMTAKDWAHIKSVIESNAKYILESSRHHNR